MRTTNWLAMVLVLGAAGSADAALLVDRAPDPTGLVEGASLVNNSGPHPFATSRQNLLLRFTLAETTTIDGFDVFSARFPRQRGGNPTDYGALVKIRADAGGAPAATNLHRIATTISSAAFYGTSPVTRTRALHADLAVTLAAGTWWIGMSGADEDIGWAYDMSRVSPGLWNVFDDALNADIGSSGDVEYRLFGTVAAPPPPVGGVPEPATWALMIGGFGVVGSMARRQRAVA